MEKFTEQHLSLIAQSQGCTIPELKTRLTIQHGKSFYVLGPDGEYLKPILRSELAQSMRRDLIRWPSEKDSPAGIEWYRKSDDALKRKTVDEILTDHCTVARYAVADMSLRRSRYDAVEQVIYEAVCPLDTIQPVYDEQIAEWLRLLCGPHHEHVLNWLATMHILSKPTCALLFTGEPGAGKEMFAQGLARRWKRACAPTELARVLDGFNEDLTRCPLIFCDENLPTKRNGKNNTLADLRSMIAASSRTLARKFLSNSDLQGSIRLVLAANNSNMMANVDAMTIADQEATAERFLHIVVNKEPVEYLKSIGGRATTEAWVAGRKIAQHVVWLEQNRAVSTDSRFLVTGNATDLQLQLLLNNKHTSLVLEWLVRYIVSGAKSTSQILVGNNKVLTNATTLCNAWNQYVKSDFAPSTTRMGISLRSLSVGDEHRIFWPSTTGEVEMRYRAIKPEYLYEWSRQNQVGDPEAIRYVVESTLDIEEMKRNNGSVPVTANGTYTNYKRSEEALITPISGNSIENGGKSFFDA